MLHTQDIRRSLAETPSFQSKWYEVRQSIKSPSFQYSCPGLQMQLLWVAEPASAVLPFGQGMHSLEVSEKFFLKVFIGHFVQAAPSPVLEIRSHSTVATRLPTESKCSLGTNRAYRCKAYLARTSPVILARTCPAGRSTQSLDCCASSFSLETASLRHCSAEPRHPYSCALAIALQIKPTTRKKNHELVTKIRSGW